MENQYITAYNGTLDDPYGCVQPMDRGVVNKSVVLLRGNCTFSEKALNAQLAGAKMVVVVYNESQSRLANPSLNESITIPVLMVGNASGEFILVSSIHTHTRTCTFSVNSLHEKCTQKHKLRISK